MRFVGVSSPLSSLTRRMRFSLVTASLTIVQTVCVALSGPPADASNVPCEVLGRNVKTCDNPYVEGIVDGQWIGAILNYEGSNGRARSVVLFTVGAGGNGPKTISLGSIKAEDDGDRLSINFRYGKLYVWNAIYLPGEAHCCSTHMVVRRFGFHGNALLPEREATVLHGASEDQVDAALEAGTHLQ